MQQTQYRIQQLHDRLLRVRHFQYRSEPGPNSTMGWAGEGIGEVCTELAGDAGLLFRESGYFYPVQGTEVAMLNCFEWQAGSCGMRLSHRRRGDAVFLFELLPEAKGTHWRCQQPHLCGADVYQGTLEMQENCILLSWRVTGPRKDEHFHYVYR